MKKLTVLLLALALLISGFALMAERATAADITLGYSNWACAEAKTYTVRAAIEKELGLEVETMMAEPAPVYSGIASGDLDAMIASWLPVTHQDYIEQYGDQMHKSGLSYSGARIGLVVPEYVDIDSIEELNEHADKFDNRIIGIDPGAGIMQATNEAIPHYDLELDLIEGSGPAMTASLSDAIENEEWIVITGWEPHWKFARFDLKFLEDPDRIYGEIENVYSWSRTDLSNDYPEAANLIFDFYMSSEQLGEVMGWISDGMEPVEAGRKWVEENEDIVEQWSSPVYSSY